MQRSLVSPLPSRMHSLPITSTPHQGGTFVTTDESILTHHHHPKCTVYLMIHSCCTFYEFGYICICHGIMTCIHHYSITQSIFTARKILCAPVIYPAPLQPLATADLFIVCIAFPFPECYIIGIIQYVAFSDWLLSLSSMLLRFLRVFSWLDTSFLFSTE